MRCRKIGRGRSYCAPCTLKLSTATLLEAAPRGRIAAQSDEAQTRRSETQLRHRAASLAWKSSDLPAWLNENLYLTEIQPRLPRITLSVLSSKLGISIHMPSIFGPLDAFHINGIGNPWHNSSVFLTHEACDFQVWVSFGVLGRNLSGKATIRPSRNCWGKMQMRRKRKSCGALGTTFDAGTGGLQMRRHHEL